MKTNRNEELLSTIIYQQSAKRASQNAPSVELNTITFKQIIILDENS